MSTLRLTEPLERPSRRDFLRHTAIAAGALVLGTFIPFARRPRAEGLAQGPIDPNVFVRIGPDNSLTIISKKFEMGQGVTTGLATLVAEELDADWSTVRYVFAPNNAKLYNNLAFGPFMATGGTTSMLETWTQMRQVGAAARSMLLAAAAARWNVPAGELSVEKSVVLHAPTGKRATFGALAADAMKLPVPAPSTLSLKTPAQWKLIGTHVPRLDSVSKTDGTAVFAMDIKRPGMLTAVVQRPLRFGAKVRAFDATEAKKVPGVVDVVQIPAGVAVLATDTWPAMRGRDLLKVEWDETAAEKRSTEQVFAEYRQFADRPGLKAMRKGDAAGKLSKAVKHLDAEFTFPYLAHAPMEPLNAVLELKPDRAELWSGSQLQSIDEYALSTTLGLKPEQIHIHTLLGGGSFGRRGNPSADSTFELATIAKAINGRAPVHLVWTREDDIKGGYYRPMALHRVRVGIDASGKISGWQHTVVSQSVFMGTPFAQMTVKDGVDGSTVEGIVDTAYAIPDMAVDVHNAASAVPVLWWRSVGHSHTAFVMESIVDELAHLGRQDPVAFRLAMLSQDPRAVAVLRLAAREAGWGTKLPKGRGRGVAFHHSFSTRVAMVAEVSVKDRQFRVERIIAAVDVGIPINPDIIEAQVEGSVGFALSTVMRNGITLKDGVVEQSNYDDYNPTRIPEMPRVEVHIVKSSEAPSGIGEPAVPPLAPAIANALFAATGQRLRSLPLRFSA